MKMLSKHTSPAGTQLLPILLLCLPAAADNCGYYEENLAYADEQGYDYRVWDGGGALERWASGLPWEGNDPPVTGTHLFFPVNGVLGYETDNNFPANTEFGSITICNDKSSIPGAFEGWIHRGNAIRLRSTLRVFGNSLSTSGNSVCRIEFPITMVAGGLVHELSGGSGADLLLTGPVNIGTVPTSFGGVELEGVVSGSSHLGLASRGRLSGNNTFTGIAEVDEEASWLVTHQNGLGSPAGHTFLRGNPTFRGTIRFQAAVCPEPFHFWGGALKFEAPGGTTHTSTLSLAGPNPMEIHSKGPTTLTQPLRKLLTLPFTPTADPNPTQVHLFGVDGGSLTLAGDVASIPAGEAFSGTLYNDSGLVMLNVNGGLAASGTLIVSGGEEASSSGTALRWMRSNQVPATAELRADEHGHIDLNGNSQTCDKLVLRNGDVSTGAGTITVTGRVERNRYAPGLALVDSVFSGNLRHSSTSPHVWSVETSDAPLIMNANVSLAAGSSTTLHKTGEGRVIWNGSASTLQKVQIDSGTMEFAGLAAGVDFVLLSAPSGAAAFQGDSCTIRDLTTSASGFYVIDFEDGESFCRNVTLTTPCHLRRNLSPLTTDEYLTASGTVTLGSARVAFTPNFQEDVIGSEYFIVNKTSPGPATGALVDDATGAAITEGQLFTVGRWIYRFSYAGGDGNDVSLKLISFVPDGSTSTWTGAGGNNFWNNGDNWGGFIMPRRSCTFPAVTNRSPVHNFPGGTFVEKVRVTADGYSFLGNAAGLLSGIELNYATGQTLFNTPLVLAGAQSFVARQSSHLRMATSTNGSTDLNGNTLRLVPLAAGSTIEFGAVTAGSDPSAALTGAGALSVEGPGEVHFNAPSSFTAPVSVLQGTVRLKRSPLALGSAAAGTTVRSGTSLHLEFPSGTIAEPFSLGGGAQLGANPGAANALTATGSLSSSSGTLTVTTGQLNASGAVSGTALLKNGSGTLQFTGGSSFALSGSGFTAEQGTSIFARSANLNTTAVITAANPSTVLRLGAAEQFAGRVSISGSATFDLNGHNETLPELVMEDGVVTTGAGTLTCPLISATGFTGSTISGKLAIPAGGTVLDVPNDDAGVDVAISAIVSGAALTKNGEGTAQLSGANTFSSAAINEGALLVTGTNTAAITLNGGMIGGTGTVGAITSAGGGNISPGSSTGILSSGSVSWNAATTFLVELNGATPGTGHDQLNVTGTVNLGGAALNMLPGSGAAGTMVIINNDGADAVTGTFAGLPENTVIAAGGKSFRISYVGGTGNDVTLSLVVTGTGVTKTWSGLGANNLWPTAANWVGGVAPVAGDDLVFPAGPFVKTCNNTFPAGTTFNSIRIADSGYGLAGNGISLNAGIVFDYATNVSSVALDVTLAGPQSVTVLQGAQGVIIPVTALATAGFPLTAQVDGAAARLTLNLLSGTGGLVKTGIGGLTMNVNNWTGPVTLSCGETKTGTLSGFGTGTSAIVAQSGAELRFENIASGTFTRPLSLSGKLEFSASPITLSGAISLPSAGQRTVEVTGSTPALSGVIGGSGGLRKTGTGSLTLSGASANTFAGGCTVADGTLRLQKSNQVALPGPVTIGDDAGTDILLYAAANQIGNAATVNLLGSGAQMQCGTFSDTIGVLRFTGGSVTGSGTLTVGERLESFAAATTATVDVNFVPSVSPFSIAVADGAAATDLAMASDWNGAATLDADRDGAGTFALRSGAMRTLTLHEGTTLVTGLFNATDILLSGGTLGGDGITTAVSTVAGKKGQLAPGASPAQLTVSAWTGDENTTLNMEVGGTTPGTQHDQLIVSGVADPRNATLLLVALAGFTPQRGQSFTLIQNNGGDRMASEFALLTEGATFEFAGTTAQITYGGGDGNDVVITILSTNSTGITRVWDGGGANNLWMTPENWDEDTAPAAGDTLRFPGAVPQLVSSNNFPAGTNFHRINIAGSGVSLSGNAVALNAGISSTQPSNAFFSIPVTLTGPQTFSAEGQGDLTFTSAATVSLNGHTLTCDINSTGDLLLQNAITGTGGVRCDSIGTAEGTGFGRVRFSAASGYSGTFTVVQGGVHLSHPGTLGTSASVSAPGALFVDATANPVFTQPITLRGGLVAEGGTARYNGAITLPAGAQGLIAGDNTILAGRIQSTGSLLVSMNFGQSLTLTGTLANTFTGGVSVISGDLILQKPAGITALPSSATINGAASRLLFAAGGQIADTASLTLNEGQCDLAGFSDTIASLAMTSGNLATGAGTLTLTGGATTLPDSLPAVITGNLAFSGAGVHLVDISDGTALPDAQIEAIITAPAGVSVRKTGAGTAGFGGACAMSDFQIADGVVFWNGNAPGTFITMDGGTLSGLGMANQITSASGGGGIAPGTSPGILHCNNIHWNAATTFTVEINGITPGTQYDQIAIEDESTLGGATLDLQLNYLPAPGETFTILTSGGTGVLDTFAGLPEGTHFIRNGTLLRINYHVGAGDNIVITAVAEPPAPEITAHSFVPGAGAEAGQTVLNVTATGLPGLNYVLEASADLQTWTPLQTLPAGPGGTVTFRALQPDTAPRTFLRPRLE